MSRLGLLGLTWLAACGGDRVADGPPGAEEAMPVQVVEVTVEPRADSLELPGTVVANRRVQLGSRLLSRVDSVNRREGERVREGEVLIRLDPRDLAAGRDQARAALQRARADRDQARRTRDRMVALAQRGSAPAQQADEAEAALARGEAAVEEAAAALELASTRLGFATLESPLTGWVASRRVEPGDLVSPGQILLVLEDSSEIEIVLEVPEARAGQLQVGTVVPVEIPAVGIRTEAPIVRIVPSVTPGSRSFEARLALPAEVGASLYAGLFARVKLPGLSSQGDRVLMPRSALVERGGLRGAFVVEGGRARLRWLALADAGPGQLEVLSGLSGGDRVVSSPPPNLLDGRAVSPDGPMNPAREVPR